MPAYLCDVSSRIEPNSISGEKIARAEARAWRFICAMPSEPVISHQICTAATSTCQSAARLERGYCRWLCGQRITFFDRPLGEAEWKLMRAFVERLERNDVNLRFGGSIDLNDEPTLQCFFDIKPGAGEIAWMLDQTEAILGVSHRIIVSPSEAEIALIVRSDLKRLGIGELLLRQMLARSARQGLKILSAWVSRENRPVLRLAATVGYRVREGSPWGVEIIFDVDNYRATIPR
jgi:GNAT superfamily N-acetyltransferase